MQPTMLYTIGTALSRARDHGVLVRLLVAGQWIEGRVGDVDGHGVLLVGADASHHVVRVQDVMAVQVKADGPLPDQPPADPHTVYATHGRAAG